MKKNEKIIREEQKVLDYKVTEINNIVDQLRTEVRNSTSKDIVLERVNRRFINDYNEAKNNPYFARVDTYENGSRETFYIGHIGVAKDKHEDIIYSWKSSIGDLYYQFHGGDGNVTVEWDSGEKFEFKVLFKRTLEIKNLKVKNYSDVVSELAGEALASPTEGILYDDFLIQLLNNRSNETQLKDIIMTIQKEQNEIIRLPLDKNIIVQGVAGSGKSSIALSRISFLLTRYRERLDILDIAIIAPNEMFINYIQKVLPTLEIENIPQLTFITLAKSLLPDLEFQNMEEPIDKLGKIISGEVSKTTSLNKTSIDFKEKIDNYIKVFETQLLDEINDFKYYDPFEQRYIILSKEEIVNRYNKNSQLPLMQRNVDSIKFVESWVNDLQDKRQKELRKEFDDVIELILKGIPKESNIRSTVYNSVEKAYEKKIKMLRDELNILWKDYKKNWESYDVFKIYKRIIELESYNVLGEYFESGNLNIFKKKLEFDDISPLIYIYSLLNGFNRKFKHLVVDEAQDLSPFQIFILKEISSSITLLGDLTQNFFINDGITDWDHLISTAFHNENITKIEINTSYRSTNPIMETSNLIIQNGNLEVPKIIPVGRKGLEVSVEQIFEPMKLLEKIIKSIQELQGMGNKKIAVIHKDLKKSKSLYEHLKNKFSSLQLVSTVNENVIEDVIIIPSFLTKGLEFDAVIIPNASKGNYGDNELDAKLLFVSVTRAQHYAKLYFHEELSPLLEGIDIDDSNKVIDVDYTFL